VTPRTRAARGRSGRWLPPACVVGNIRDRLPSEWSSHGSRRPQLRHSVTPRTPHNPLGRQYLPVEFVIAGWKLQLTETELKARPDGHVFHGEGAARADLEPSLHGWAASAEVADRIRMEISFLDAEMRRIVPVSLYGTGRLQVGASDFGTSRGHDRRDRSGTRSNALWSDDSPVAREAPEYCLRPMRALRRPVPDSAYGLVTQLEEWAGGCRRLPTGFG
jgi:hypothetical protein